MSSEGKDERLQVLTHPVWWQDTVMSPRQRIHRYLDEAAKKKKDRYDRTLEEHGRENLDWD